MAKLNGQGIKVEITNISCKQQRIWRVPLILTCMLVAKVHPATDTLNPM